MIYKPDAFSGRGFDDPEPSLADVSDLIGELANMTRPLCTYPQQAAYKGTGSTNDAQNFVCK